MRDATVAAGLVAGLFRYATSLGADGPGLIRDCGIRARELDDPDARIPLDTYLALFESAKADLGDPALAVRHGAEIGMSELSIVGLLMEASDTIGDAFVQMQRYGQLAMQIDTVDPSSRFDLTFEQGRMFLVDRIEPVEQLRAVIESGFAWLVCGPRRYMDRSPVMAIQFSWPKPDWSEVYDSVFRCPIEYNAARNALEMHPDSLSWQVGQNPHYVFSMLTGRAESLLKELRQNTSIGGRVRALMASTIHRGDLTAETAAAKLGMSRQTLYRRLKGEGLSYQKLLDDLRLTLAQDYLRGGQASINEIAFLLGFSDPAAFSRAFSRWTGQAPGEFRRALRD